MKYVTMRTALTASAMGVLFALCDISYAQVKTTYQENNVDIPTIDEQAPDTTGLWFHIRKKQIRLANDELGRLQVLYPAWTVPEEILSAIYTLNNPKRVTSPSTSVASRNNQAADIPEPAKDAALRAFASLSEKKRLRVSEAQFGKLSTLAISLANFDYHMVLGWTAIDKQWWNNAKLHFDYANTLSRSTYEAKGAQEGLRIITDKKVQGYLDNNAISALEAMLGGHDEPYIKEIVSGRAWQYCDKEQYSKALVLFDVINDSESLWLTHTAMGDMLAAGQLACDLAHTERFVKRCADYWAQQQVKAYENDAYETSINAAHELKKIRRLTSDEYALLGWSAKATSQSRLATKAFEEVLQVDPSNDDIAFALYQLSRDDKTHLERLSKTYPAIAALQATELHASAWPRKQFLLAFNAHDPRVTAAQTKDAFTVTAGLHSLSRSGFRGLGRFDQLNSYISIGDIYEGVRWQVALDYGQRYSGAPRTNDWFGDSQLSEPFGGITGFEDKGVRGELEYQKEGATYYANVAYRFFDQPVDATLTGQLSGTWYLSKTTVAGNVFRQPKQDSLLSNTGTFNAERTAPWGYAIEDGVSMLVAHNIKPLWTIAATASASQINGEFIKDNSQLSLRIDMNKDIAEAISPQLDYWRVGPFLSYTTYADNLSGFTYGQGGYFSPEQFVSVGMYTELLTLEAKQWQVKLAGSLGYSRIEEGSAARFPLGLPNNVIDDELASERIEASTQNGIAGQLLAEGQYRITDSWIVAGYVRKSYAVEFEDISAGIQIRYRGGKGEGVTSDELMLSSPRLSGFAL
ncbi:cellulose synthase subunit BcsC-related outer membrane protein [Alteromonas sp. A079]|uniref:cellulose synthase subunit BcsC-related outer membrane protein n=1 Tax=Alteromonas sp. A079 TaxID=3410268 RepID=UPI003BA1D1C7